MSDRQTAEALCAVMNIQRILSFLPHRYPFLLVDRVVAFEPLRHIDAYKCVSVNEPFFHGHFPEQPVMPGVLIVEAMAQASALLVLSGEGGDMPASSLFLFAGIENARFRKPVIPGDRLDLHCELLRRKLNVYKVRCSARVGESLAAEAELTAAVVSRESLQ
ncbi:MAG: 3-hydroxyacyl-ACP dehydratase FabZ [Desulfovibrio sp.]|jgi:3-hydroxyacyl-[acyl-carrier-protein] dehydratase|nr:3-hydroxyacyl-ACP dehydratase FabZ [Desulfovibrio sp.]